MPENSKQPLIAQLGLDPSALGGKTVIVTGAGGGIGYEAARALLWLGGNVVIAEINPHTGLAAVESLGAAFGPDRVMFIQTDVGDTQSVKNLAEQAGGYEKDPAKLEANLRHISAWKAEVERLEDMLRTPVIE